MTDASVHAIRLPRLRSPSLGSDLARNTLHRVLQNLQVGSLSLRDSDSCQVFGDSSDGGPHAEVTIHDPLAYQAILLGGSVGAGEAYMQGYWSSADLVSVIRVFTANMQMLSDMDAGKSWWKRAGLALAHRLNNNTLAGSKRNIAAHYDLGNDFFSLFLDPSMMYSSAIFPNPQASLEEASACKLERICQQLELTTDDHLLEIGTGWGGMAIYAAQHYGCRVTTTTISREQYEYARQRVQEAGLEDQVTLLCEDYRQLTGQYDKLVSIEMIEAVGHQFYSTYFAKCSSLLKPDGLMLIQAITMTDQRYASARDNVDFIKRYIFPGGCLPSVEVISTHLRKDTDMQVVDLHDMTADYAKTLAAWRNAFRERLDAVEQMGFDRTFQRMWEFYLCYCEGGFRERCIGTVQLTFAKPGYRFD